MEWEVRWIESIQGALGDLNGTVGQVLSFIAGEIGLLLALLILLFCWKIFYSFIDNLLDIISFCTLIQLDEKQKQAVLFWSNQNLFGISQRLEILQR